MGNTKSLPEASRRVSSKIKTWNQLSRDIEFINSLTLSESFTKRSGYCLLFSVFTTLTNPDLIPLLWKVNNNVMVSVVKLYEEENAATKQDVPGVTTPRVLTIRQFYHIFCCLQDVNLPEWHLLDEKTKESSRKMSNVSEYDINAAWEFDRECMICMEDQTQVALPCSHAFCETCIKTWNIQSLTCPVCRNDVKKGASDFWVFTDDPENDYTDCIFDSLAYINKYIDTRQAVPSQPQAHHMTVATAGEAEAEAIEL
eukprot:GILJ01001304.1.p1 GENE.GILJ01001304.1~~GILJ01001304.1.p1  ORF type:complete len:256 (+),score=18.29 GILJ01001304.1:81-848(+)